MIRGLFITATGTGVGKTFLGRALALAARDQGLRVAALKPIETGCSPEPADALALALACGQAEFAHDVAFYRARPPLSPYAATLAASVPAPDVPSIVSRIRTLAALHDRTIVEGAGGLLVPIDAEQDMATFARVLGYPLLLVAPNRIGTLAYTLATHEAARSRGLVVAAVVLTEPDPYPDPSSSSNAVILAERLATPVVGFPRAAEEDAALAAAVHQSGLFQRIGWA